MLGWLAVGLFLWYTMSKPPDKHSGQSIADKAAKRLASRKGNMMSAAGPKKYTIHPVAAMLPKLQGEEFEALAADMETNGQLEPIDVYKDEIIDGVNRFMACESRGLEQWYRQWVPKNGQSVIGYIISKALLRRHMDTSQRAMFAAELAQLNQGQHKSKPIPIESGKFATDEQDEETPEFSLEEASGLLNVSKRSTQDARDVLEKGSTVLQDAVKAGDVSVSDAAKIVDQPKAEQRAAVKAVEQGKSPTVAAATHRPSANGKPKTAKDKAIAAHGALCRALDDLKLYEKHKDAHLRPILNSIKAHR